MNRRQGCKRADHTKEHKRDRFTIRESLTFPPVCRADICTIQSETTWILVYHEEKGAYVRHHKHLIEVQLETCWEVAQAMQHDKIIWLAGDWYEEGEDEQLQRHPPSSVTSEQRSPCLCRNEKHIGSKYLHHVPDPSHIGRWGQSDKQEKSTFLNTAHFR